jgi:hypothetical protein
MRSITPTARLGAPLLALALTACAGGAGGEIAGEPGVMAAVRTYYESHGLENGGRCLHPKVVGTPLGQVIESTADRLLVEVAYTYRDPTTIYKGACGGSGTRVFTLTRTSEGPKVTDMTGPRHPGGIHFERIDDGNVW